MKHFLLVASVISCIAFAQASNGQSLKDKRLADISTVELTKLISATPLNSPIHQELLLRASHSHLMIVAYDQYSVLWQQHPNSADTNLWRGIAAEYLFSDSMYPELRKTYSKVATDLLLPTATTCLAKAVKVAPNSPTANREDGFFLWQYGNKLPEGLLLLRKALRLAPSDPRTHTMWGNVYANPDGKAYDLKKAIYELRVANSLDPSYAFPHELLSNIYARQNLTVMAMQEQMKFQQLMP